MGGLRPEGIALSYRQRAESRSKSFRLMSFKASAWICELHFPLIRGVTPDWAVVKIHRYLKS